MSDTLTREGSSPPDPHPAEVLMPEARAHRRRRLAVRSSVAVLVVAAVVALVVSAFAVGWVGNAKATSPSTSRSTTPGRTTVGASAGLLPVGALDLAGTSCSSPTSCVAVGAGGIGAPERNVAYRTSDGGRVWSQASTPSLGGGMQSVACVGQTCIAGGGYDAMGLPIVDRTANGGARWVALTPSLGKGSVIATACATATACLLSTQRHAFWSSNGGLTWHDAAASDVSGFTTLACASATTCYGTADPPGAPDGPQDARFLMRTIDAGRSWSVVERLGASAELLSTTCPRPASCSVLEMVLEMGGLRYLAVTSSDGGAKWTAHRMPSAARELGGLVCATPAACFAWAAPPIAPGTQPRVDLRTDDGGRSWTIERLPGVVINSLTCSSAASCELVGSDSTGVLVMGTHDGFGTWSSQALPVGLLRVNGTACADLTTCTVVGEATRGGATFSSSDGGRSWSVGGLPRGTSPVTGIACPTATFCAATANGILTSHDAGRSWLLQRLALGTSTLWGVSCSSSTDCVLVGGTAASVTYPARPPAPAALVFVWRDGRLHRVAFPGVDSQLAAVSCASGGTCVAVGGAESYDGSYRGTVVVGYSHDGGLTWKASRLPSSVASFQDVSCPTSRVCVAVGAATSRTGTASRIIASVDGGVTWQIVRANGPEFGWYSKVACASPTHCVATGVDSVGDVSIVLNAPHPGSPFVSSMLTPAYGLIGVTASGVLFGVPASAPADQPLIVRVA